jgi:hypothetical protein
MGGVDHRDRRIVIHTPRACTLCNDALARSRRKRIAFPTKGHYFPVEGRTVVQKKCAVWSSLVMR